MNWKPERISTKVVIPLVSVVIISLGLVFVLLTRHTRETVVRLNTTSLQLETKRLYYFCEKAIEELVVAQQFGNPTLVAAKKEVVLSEIENHLLSEGIDGFTAKQQNILLSTIEIGSGIEFEGASGTLKIESREGLFYGYYLYFPVWEWYLVTLLHEEPYWSSNKRILVFLTLSGGIYITLGVVVLLILLYGLQRPLSVMVKQLHEKGRISLRTGTKELDLLSTTINRQLESILQESNAKAQYANDLKISNRKLAKLTEELENRVRERTAELSEAYIRMQEMGMMKTAFLSSVSHELRTPLTSVLGFSALIKRKLTKIIFPQVISSERKTERAMEQTLINLDIIIEEGERLTNLINDVLDIAKIESGLIEWKEEEVDLGEVFDKAATSLSPLFEKKRLAVKGEIDEGELLIIADGDRMQQVVINLFSNAIKFTEKGEIHYKVSRENDHWIRCQVEDSGIGIPADQLEEIFLQFKQVENTLIGKPQGTGLGLPICKEILRHYGGEIWAESEVGKGSVFVFRIPNKDKERYVKEEGGNGEKNSDC